MLSSRAVFYIIYQSPAFVKKKQPPFVRIVLKFLHLYPPFFIKDDRDSPQPVDNFTQVFLKGRTQIVAGECKLHCCLEKTQFVADVIALARKLVRVHPLALHKRL